MPKVADDRLGLELSVLSVRETCQSPEAMLQDVPASSLILRLTSTDGRAGLALLDDQLLAGLIEIQMIGSVSSSAPSERRPTPTDAAISTGAFDAWAEAFDREIEAMSERPVWAGTRTAGSFPEPRAALMTLPADDLQIATLTLDLGGGARQGRLTIGMPKAGAKGQGRSATEANGLRFGDALRPVVLASEATIEAVLHRPSVPYMDVKAFKVGDIVRLPVETLSSVTLEAPDGQVVAKARLGQVEGHRAVRLEMTDDQPGAIPPLAFAAPQIRVEQTAPVGTAGTPATGSTHAGGAPDGTEIDGTGCEISGQSVFQPDQDIGLAEPGAGLPQDSP
jgi:flagellar motor switch protein FliM